MYALLIRSAANLGWYFLSYELDSSEEKCKSDATETSRIKHENRKTNVCSHNVTSLVDDSQHVVVYVCVYAANMYAYIFNLCTAYCCCHRHTTLLLLVIASVVGSCKQCGFRARKSQTTTKPMANAFVHVVVGRVFNCDHMRCF